MPRVLRDRWLWVILGLALTARLLAIAVTGDYEPRVDSLDYALHAESIASGSGYPESRLLADGGPTAFRPPAYPYLLGGVFAVSGDSVLAGRVLNALLGVVAVLLVYLLARRLFGARVARVAGVLCAGFPPLVFEATTLLSEPLFVALVLGMALVFVIGREAKEPWRWALAAGILCGAATLTRSNGILLILSIVLWAAMTTGTWRLRLRLGAVAAIGLGIALAPWAIRNSLAFDEVVLGSTQTGYGLVATYNEEARENTRFTATHIAPQFSGPHTALFRQPEIDEADLDAELRERAIDYIADDPAYVLKVSAYNALRTADLIESSPDVSLLSGGSTLGNRSLDLARWSTWALLLLALAGAALLARRQHRKDGVIWLIPLLAVLPAIPVIGGVRYRAPADPFLCLLAGVAVAAAFAFWQRRRSERMPQAHAD